MRLARTGPRGEETPILLDDDGNAYDIRSLTDDIDGEFLAADGINQCREALQRGALAPIDVHGRWGAPVAAPPSIICIGMNYAAHAAETGSPPPDQPIMFLKTTNTITGPNDAVAVPRGAAKTDWEVELGVVISRRASYLNSPADSLGHVAGYVAANDLSERSFQLQDSGGQWSKGKCCPGFSPLGPWLRPADEIHHQDLSLRSWVNGEARQASTTSDMIFDVPTLVHHLSQYMTLEPGDVILTGTPEGVALSGRFPYLVAGDVCEVEIEGLGRQRTTFVREVGELE